MSERTTNYHDHVPIHRLNSPQTVLWLYKGNVQRRMASNLSKRYKAGVGVCSATLRLIAYVDPNGGVRELAYPHKKYEMHQISNQPLLTECQCAAFFDPESGGAWRKRDDKLSRGEHHPMCQFERVGQKVFEGMVARSPGRTIVGIDKNEAPVFFDHRGVAAVRPDEAIKMRETLK